ncbi:hypothetical protein LGK97_00240 [Clostridium sp. CS001]|uniref:hypothetical protein n=1 Tax=Clostridium sp. CS001 TaxID=2880648 RepID=UPI001CF530DB|nr:hypothetical protein [Clostridium sp. CS001]MCB2288191.1 hypothetical protein [Clostridium sp. CS001]
MKKGLKIFLGAIFLAAMVLVYNTYYSYTTQPPSEKWSKEVKVSSGAVKSNVKVLKFNANYIIAHDDGTAIKVIETDLIGNVLKENKIETGKFMNYITLFTDGKNLFVSYVEPNQDSGSLYTITLNGDLKEVKSEETKDVQSVQLIDDEMLLLVYSNKMEIINPKTGVKIVENTSTKIVAGSKSSDGTYLISYRVDEEFLAIKVKNDKIVERYTLGELILISGTAIKAISTSSDETHIYLLIEMLDKGIYGNMQILSYDKSNKNGTIKRLFIDNESYLFDSVSVENRDGSAEFLIDVNNNFLDVKFKNNEIIQVQKVTRMVNYAFNIGVNDNAIVFINGGELNDVYLASTDGKFKQANNGNREEESKYAFSTSISHIINDIIMTPLYASFPLIISSIPMIITLFIFYDSGHRNKRRVVLMFSYIMLILLKVWKVYEKCFQKYPDILPKLINNPVIITLIMVLISSICMYLAYEKFEKNEHSIDLWTFIKYGSIDIFISTMFYLPYIV